MPEPLILHLTPEALELFQRFQERCEHAQRPGRALHWLPSWASKLPGQTLRIAGILHVLDRNEGTWEAPIDAHAMTNAIRIAECLVDHSRAVHDVLGQDGPHADARLVHKWLAHHKPCEVTLRDVYRNVKPLKGPKRARAAISVLEDYGWLAPAWPDPDEEDGTRRPGRPGSPSWIVNPVLRQGPGSDEDGLVDLFDAA